MSKIRAKFWTAVALCSAASVFQIGFPTSCIQFGLQTGLTAFDTCSVLNCNDGVFFDLCDPFIVLIDCPNLFEDTTP